MDTLPVLSYSKTIPQYVGMPIAQIDALGKDLEANYNENLNKRDAIETAMSNLSVRDVNQPIIQQQKDAINSTLQQYTEAGDWENANQTIRDLSRSVTNNPLLKGALNDKAQYDGWRKDLDEQLAKGTINKDQYEYHLLSSLQGNKDAVSYDKEAGTYSNIFNGSRPNKDMSKEMQEQVNKLAGMWKASTVDAPVTVKDAKGNTRQIAYSTAMNGYYDIASREYIDEREVKDALVRDIKSNPMYTAFLDESAKIDTWKAKKANNGVLDVKTIYDPKNPNGGMISDKEYEQLVLQLAKGGVDLDKVFDNPAVVEDLYTMIAKNKRIDAITDAPAKAVSYSKLTHDYKPNVDYAEALKFKYDVALSDRKHQQAMQRDAINDARKDKKEKEQESALVFKTQGTVADATGGNSKAFDAEVTMKQSFPMIDRISQLRQKGGALNQSEKEELQTLERTVSQKHATIRLGVEEYLKTPEGSKWFNEAYDKFSKFNGGVKDQLNNVAIGTNGKPMNINFHTKEGFKEALLNPDFQKWVTQEGTSNKIGRWLGRGIITPTYTNNITSAVTEIGSKGVDLLSKASASNKENGNKFFMQGLTGTVYDSPKDGKNTGVYEKVNTGLTEFYQSNKQGFIVAGGQRAIDWENNILKDVDEKQRDKLQINIVTSDADHSIDGVPNYPNQIQIRNKETGEVLKSTWLYSNDASGGAELRYQVGTKGMKNFDRNTAEYRDAEVMAATGKYSHIVTKDLERAAAGRAAEGRTYSFQTKMDGQNVKLVAQQKTYYDENGVPQTPQIRWQAVFVNSKGEPVKNPQTGKIEKLPNQLTWKDGNSDDEYDFGSVNDIKINALRLTHKQ